MNPFLFLFLLSCSIWLFPRASLAACSVANGTEVCPTISDLRASKLKLSAAQTVFLQNYYSGLSGGGGFLYATGQTCNVYTLSGTSTSTPNEISIAGSTATVSVGDATTAGQQSLVPDYDYVTGIVDSTHILLALAPNSTLSSSTIKLSCDNTGTVFSTDSVAGATDAFAYARISNYSQAEWGAIEPVPPSKQIDVSAQLQLWLDAFQPHNGTPATLLISSPLICPTGSSIQGAQATAVAEDSTYMPPFIIQGDTGLVGGAMMTTQGSCGLHAVTMLASTSGNVYDVLDASTKSVVVDQHSYFANGYFNVSSAGGGNGGAANFEAYDSAFNNSLATNLYITSPNVKISRNSIAGSGQVASAALQNFSMQTTTSSSGTNTLSFPGTVAPATVGLTVNAPSFPSNTYITSLNSGTITLSNSVVVNGGENIEFSQPVTLVTNAVSKTTGVITALFFNAAPNVVRGMSAYLNNQGALTLLGYVTYPNPNGTEVDIEATVPVGKTQPVTFAVPTESSNIHFGGSEAFIADNIIQQGGGWGINLITTKSVRIGTNFFDNNGRAISGTGAINIKGSYHVTVCNNTFSQSGLTSELDPSSLVFPGVAPPYSAHINFSGNNNIVSFCGNVYLPDQSSGSNNANSTPEASILTYPDYAFDVTTPDSLSNIQIADNNAPQISGLLTPNAIQPLSGAMQNLPTAGAINGLTLSNELSNGLPTSVIDIAPGSATDSSGTATIALTKTCTVDLSTATPLGPGGLDNGPVMNNQTYFFFVMSGPNGTNPSCIASANTTPDFTNASAYAISGSGVTSPNSGSAGFPYNTIFNVINSAAGPTLPGVLPGDLVTSPNSSALPARDTILSVSNFRIASVGATLSGTSRFATSNALPPGLLAGMSVAGMNILPGTTVSAPPTAGCTSPCSTQLSQKPSTNAGTGSGSVLTFSGGITLTMTLNSTGSSSFGSPASLSIFPVRYRLVGALYTTSTTGTLVAFNQNANTFYLATPVLDVSTTAMTPICTSSVGTMPPATCPLSVPCGRNAKCVSNGISVEAFGRMSGGTKPVLIYSPSLLSSMPQPSSDLTTAPGYATLAGGATAVTAYPFRSFTDTSGDVILRSTVLGAATVYETTDGWVLPR